MVWFGGKSCSATAAQKTVIRVPLREGGGKEKGGGPWPGKGEEEGRGGTEQDTYTNEQEKVDD